MLMAATLVYNHNVFLFGNSLRFLPLLSLIMIDVFHSFKKNLFDNVLLTCIPTHGKVKSASSVFLTNFKTIPLK